MSWRPGEVWLDTDGLWARAGEAARAAAGPDLAWIPDFGPPPGLLASRERRAAWKGRRKARRARTTALVLSPALVVVLAGLRGERDAISRILADDPPTLTQRLGSVAPVTELPQAVRDGGEAVRSRQRPTTAAPAAGVPKLPVIAWRRATSVGAPHDGSLVGGTQLPLEGPGWVTWNPVRDGSPNLPNRLYGHERLVRAVLAVVRAYASAHPAAAPVVIGDLSRKGGGPMTDEHVSHQNGLDVDVYLPRLDRKVTAPTAPDQVDRRLAQDLLDRFLAAGAEVVFTGHASGLRGPSSRVVHYRGHEYHLHVRFPRPGN
jgi:murein endopeptidase